MALAGALRVFGLRCHVWFLLCLFGAVARRDFGPQLTKRFLNFLARCIGHGRNWASLIRRQLSGGHDDALDVRARLGENALHIKFFAHGSSYAAGRPFHIIAVHQEPCTNAGNAAVLGLAQGAVLLAPTENAFDRPAALLRQAITCMACGAAIDRASSQLAGLGRALVLRHMRSWCAKLSCESFAIGVLLAAMWGSEEHHSPAAVANVNKGSEKMETDDYARRW